MCSLNRLLKPSPCTRFLISCTAAYKKHHPRSRTHLALRGVISAILNNRSSNAAVQLYQQLRVSTFKPSIHDFVFLLKACARKEAFSLGELLHADIRKHRLQSNLAVANALLHMYSKCGRIGMARKIFFNLPRKDIVSWNTIMTGLVQNGCDREAIEVFENMQWQGLKPDRVSYLAVLKAYCNTGLLEQGKQIDAQLTELGWESDGFLGCALIHMYTKFGMMDDACRVFDGLADRDVVSWTAIISGFARHGRGEDTLNLFRKMRMQGVKPNKVTFICLLKACGSIMASDEGHKIHNILKENGMESELSVGNALIDMYAKCGSLSNALQVFMKLPVRDVVSWTTMISGFVHNGQNEDALQFFEKMQNEKVVPNRVTYLCALKACGGKNELVKCQYIHSHLTRTGFINDVCVANTLISMYVKSGCMNKARQVFWKLSNRDIVSWNVLIDGYAENKNALQALRIFEVMQKEGVKPDTVTYISVLKACRNAKALNRGKWIHNMIISNNLEDQVVLGNILVDMYCKCGSLNHASEAFWKLPERDVISWNTLLDGYAQQGHATTCLNLFKKMMAGNLRPDKVTFVCLLTACNHAGLLYEGYLLFERMQITYGILPEIEHYSCMIDLLGRFGNLEEAANFIQNMRIQPDAAVWLSLLGACQTHSNLEVGKAAFESALKLDPRNSAAYAMMSNIYASYGMHMHEACLRAHLSKF